MESKATKAIVAVATLIVIAAVVTHALSGKILLLF